jgi:hypothetical protein
VKGFEQNNQAQHDDDDGNRQWEKSFIGTELAPHGKAQGLESQEEPQHQKEETAREILLVDQKASFQEQGLLRDSIPARQTSSKRPWFPSFLFNRSALQHPFSWQRIPCMDPVRQSEDLACDALFTAAIQIRGE